VLSPELLNPANELGNEWLEGGALLARYGRTIL
jgi:hypothetical protein